MRRLGKTATGVLGLVTLMALAAPANVQAGFRSRDDHGRRHHRPYRHHDDHGRHGGGSFRQGSHHRGFAVPRHVGYGAHASHGRYYQQRVYHRGHRHHHTVYRYPVYTGGSQRSYRSYAYCDAALYSGYRDGLHVSLSTPYFRVAYSGH